MKLKDLTVGRIVHVRCDGACMAAMVVSLTSYDISNGKDDRVVVRIFGSTHPHDNVVEDENAYLDLLGWHDPRECPKAKAAKP